jgi:hypothetical protein
MLEDRVLFDCGDLSSTERGFKDVKKGRQDPVIDCSF